MFQILLYSILLGFPNNFNNLNGLLSRRDIIKTSNIITTMSLLDNNNNNDNNSNNDNNDDINKNLIKNNDREVSFIGSISKTNKKNNIYFYSSLNEESVFKLNSNLLYLMESLETGQEINLHIQSSGGNLLPSISTVDLIRTSDIPINTFIEGYAASAATLISVVGAKRFMTKNSVMLIHQLKMGTDYSKFNEIEDYYNNAETLMNIVKNIYLENTDLDKKLLDELLNKDLWLNSTFCQNNKLVDIII